MNQWASQPVADATGLQVWVYPEGQRARRSPEAEANARPEFKLPAGRYDVVVSYGTVRREANGVVVTAGTTTTRAVDLQLGALEVILQYGAGQAAGGSAYVQVVRSDDPQRMPGGSQERHAIGLRAARRAVRRARRGAGRAETVERVDVRVGTGDPAGGQPGCRSRASECAGFGGEPADTQNGLVVQAFSPQDHGNPIAADYNNPAQLHLPAGALRRADPIRGDAAEPERERHG